MIRQLFFPSIIPTIRLSPYNKKAKKGKRELTIAVNLPVPTLLQRIITQLQCVFLREAEHAREHCHVCFVSRSAYRIREREGCIKDNILYATIPVSSTSWNTWPACFKLGSFAL